MGGLHLTIASLPELVMAIFSAGMVLTSYLLSFTERYEQTAVLAFRWIVLSIALLMFSMFLRHSVLVHPEQAMWWTYLVEMAMEHMLKPGYAFGEEFGIGLEIVLEGLEKLRGAG
jgi:hypothetical protein